MRSSLSTNALSGQGTYRERKWSSWWHQHGCRLLPGLWHDFILSFFSFWRIVRMWQQMTGRWRRGRAGAGWMSGCVGAEGTALFVRDGAQEEKDRWQDASIWGQKSESWPDCETLSHLVWSLREMGRERARGCGESTWHSDPAPRICFLAVIRVGMGFKSFLQTWNSKIASPSREGWVVLISESLPLPLLSPLSLQPLPPWPPLLLSRCGQQIQKYTSFGSVCPALDDPLFLKSSLTS